MKGRRTAGIVRSQQDEENECRLLDPSSAHSSGKCGITFHYKPYGEENVAIRRSNTFSGVEVGQVSSFSQAAYSSSFTSQPL